MSFKTIHDISDATSVWVYALLVNLDFVSHKSEELSGLNPECGKTLYNGQCLVVLFATLLFRL